MVRRIDAIMTAGEDGDGAGGKARAVRGCAMPRARPETMANPASQSPCAIRCVSLMPPADALREPTIATCGMANTVA
jgi:hypothetical protein